MLTTCNVLITEVGQRQVMVPPALFQTTDKRREFEKCCYLGNPIFWAPRREKKKKKREENLKPGEHLESADLRQQGLGEGDLVSFL